MKKIIGVSVFIALLITLVITNIALQGYRSFFTFQIKDFIAIMMALIVSYYFSQKKNDFRKLKEEADDVVEKIQEIIMQLQNRYHAGGNGNYTTVLPAIYNMHAKFNLLKKVSHKIGIEEELAYCLEELMKCEKIIKEASDESIGGEVYGLLANIDNKLDEVQLSLYQ